MITALTRESLASAPRPARVTATATAEGLGLELLDWDWMAIDELSPTDNDCLHRWERARYDGFRSPLRRATFLAGRIAAKRLLTRTACPAADLRDLAILSWNRAGRGVPPRVWFRGRLLPGNLSISHDDWQAVAVWTAPHAAPIGIDVSTAAAAEFPRGALLFGPEELRWLRESGSQSRGATRAGNDRGETARDWFSLKEAAFKVSGEASFQPLRFRLATSVERNCDRNGDCPPHDFETRLESRSLATRCRLALARRNRPFRPADHTSHYSLAPPQLQQYS